jgi:signal transduction histidine kinase
MRLWPDSLAGRTLAILLGITLLLIAGSAILLQQERDTRFDERNRFSLLNNISTLVRLVEDAGPRERRRIVDRISKENFHASVTPTPLVEGPPRHHMENFLANRLRNRLNLPAGEINVRIRMDRDAKDDDEHMMPRQLPRSMMHEWGELDYSIRLGDGSWLNIRVDNSDAPPPWAGKTLGLLVLLLVALIASSMYLSQRMARPMAQLAKAADRLGLGQAVSLLAEIGPREVRHTIRAFNRMQERTQKHISDRTLMLAAVSHDLRTPITTLRLRAEYIEDEDMRNKTLGTLAEMEAILSATLGFARDDAADESARPTDIPALLQSLADDHVDLGGSVTYHGPEKLTFTCRPIALRRALNNLIENALKYGGSAEVHLAAQKAGIEICIDDKGPGIPEDKLTDVFTPFFRLDESRSSNTGGTGLGLSVALTIAHAHGGELSLINRQSGGLRARLVLPRLEFKS